MPNIIEIILPTFFVVFIGYLVGKFSRIKIEPVVDINIYVAVPALVFVSLVSRKIILLDAVKIWAAAIVIIYGCLLAAWLTFKILGKKHSGLYVPITIMNTVNIPFPVIYLAYGANGMVPAILFDIPNNLSLYTFGIFTFAGKRWKENIREIFRLPVIYAAILGLLLNFLNIKVPELLFNSLDFLSKMAIPLVLLVLGYNLSRSRMTSFPTTLLASFLRIGVGLAIGLAVVNVFNITGVFRSVVILDSAMPAAIMSSVLATKYQSEPGLVSSVVLLTTLASVAVIPLILNWLG